MVDDEYTADLDALGALAGHLSQLAGRLHQDDDNGWQLSGSDAGDRRLADAVSDFAASWRTGRQHIESALDQGAQYVADARARYLAEDEHVSATMDGILGGLA
jgi:hypothetical protein